MEGDGGIGQDMAERVTWVVVFDVANIRRLRKMSRFLVGRGHRVQRSVFEVLATSREMTALLEKAVQPERFAPGVDSLRAYRLCAVCHAAAEVRGVGQTPLSAQGAVVF
jgi:CRISPR-associated protein Cas2